MILKKITKFHILGVINCLLAFWPLSMLLGVVFYPPHQVSLSVVVHEFLPDMVLLGSLGINLYLAYIIFWQKYEATKFKYYLLLTFLAFFWLFWLMLGYFFSSFVTYPVVSLIMAVGIFFLVKRFSFKLAIAVFIISLSVTILAIAFGFEEDYCVRKGEEIAKDKPATIVIPGKEAKDLFGSDIDITASGSSEVGTSAYYHFKCHTTFDFGKTLKEKYLLK